MFLRRESDKEKKDEGDDASGPLQRELGSITQRWYQAALPQTFLINHAKVCSSCHINIHPEVMLLTKRTVNAGVWVASRCSFNP